MNLEDRAQHHEAKEWEFRNAARSGPFKFSPGEPGYGPEFCEKCSDDMPDARRVYGFKVCVTCKAQQEASLARRVR